jgi:hypothetical protein
MIADAVLPKEGETVCGYWINSAWSKNAIN